MAAPSGQDFVHQAVEGELRGRRQVLRREPAQFVDVVRRLRTARAEASGPEQVERRPSLVVAHPDSEQASNLEPEPGLLAHLPDQAVDGMFTFPDETAYDVPRATKRLERTTREQHATVLLRQRARGHGRVRVVRESAGVTLDEAVAVRKLTSAARTHLPSVEQRHEKNLATRDRSNHARAFANRTARHAARGDARETRGANAPRNRPCR